ncbi:hypothetical protein OROMI_006984 [Orobanche minor]
MMSRKYDTKEEFFLWSQLNVAIDGIFDSYHRRDEVSPPVTLPPSSPVLAVLVAAAAVPPPPDIDLAATAHQPPPLPFLSPSLVLAALVDAATKLPPNPLRDTPPAHPITTGLDSLQKTTNSAPRRSKSAVTSERDAVPITAAPNLRPPTILPATTAAPQGAPFGRHSISAQKHAPLELFPPAAAVEEKGFNVTVALLQQLESVAYTEVVGPDAQIHYFGPHFLYWHNHVKCFH